MIMPSETDQTVLGSTVFPSLSDLKNGFQPASDLPSKRGVKPSSAPRAKTEMQPMAAARENAIVVRMEHQIAGTRGGWRRTQRSRFSYHDGRRDRQADSFACS